MDPKGNRMYLLLKVLEDALNPLKLDRASPGFFLAVLQPHSALRLNVPQELKDKTPGTAAIPSQPRMFGIAGTNWDQGLSSEEGSGR